MKSLGARSVNSNPLQFEEFAASMASLASYMKEGEGGFDNAVERLDTLFTKARKQPLGYRDVTDLTGQSLNSVDQHSGRAAWLLQHTDGLRVLAVHSKSCHKVGNRISSPLVDQVETVLKTASVLANDKLQEIGVDDQWIDVVGIKDDRIWLVQVVTAKVMKDSAIKRSKNRNSSLFRSRVFDNRKVDEKAINALRHTSELMRAAFPTHDVFTLVLELHPEGPDFELYQVKLNALGGEVNLTEDLIVSNSIDFQDEIAADHDLLWTMPERHDQDPLFKGIPPCRGGRTLNMFAAMANKQMNSTELLMFSQGCVADLLKQEFELEIPRDKIRHDLEDRLANQGLIRKWGSLYFLTIRGVARYSYFLAKYSTGSVGNALSVVDACSAQRDIILQKFGYVV